MINKIKKIISSFFINEVYMSPYTKDLKDKVVVITGGTKGVGKAVAEVLLNEGAKVVVISRNNGDADLFNKFDEKQYLMLNGDVTNEVDVKRITESVISRFKKIDVLVNNAGVFLEKPLELTELSEYEKIVETNIRGIFLMCKHILPNMKQNKSGFIVNIGSKISHNTRIAPNKVLYATTKYAVEGFSYALNKEVGKDGIRVACLMPATINTFVSLKSKDYLSPFDIGFVILTMIKAENIDFESVLIKSKDQNI